MASISVMGVGWFHKYDPSFMYFWFSSKNWHCSDTCWSCMIRYMCLKHGSLGETGSRVRGWMMMSGICGNSGLIMCFHDELDCWVYSYHKKTHNQYWKFKCLSGLTILLMVLIVMTVSLVWNMKLQYDCIESLYVKNKSIHWFFMKLWVILEF